MTIDRKAVAGMDFSALSTGRRLKPVHPGEVLLKDFIEPMGLTRLVQHAFCKFEMNDYAICGRPKR